MYWAAGAGAMLLVAAYGLLNVWAAADLGYDTSARGKSILTYWMYVVMGSIFGSLLCAALSWRAWRAAPSERF
jgi:hypothetical protein